MSNTPSDAEIGKLAAEHLKAFAQFTGAGEVWFEGEVDFARAVLAKWGQPQAVAGGEPVAWLSTDSIGERYLCFTKPNDSDPVRPLVFGDTTPQPTQAQAGAVPLNHKNIEPVRRFLADRGIYFSDETTKALITVSQGIKGGQYGADI